MIPTLQPLVTEIKMTKLEKQQIGSASME